ncbi:hypothetical protein GCM10027422_43640 [Hymenobacter arcticus]
MSLRFLLGLCLVLSLISALGWLAGVASRALLWPMLLFGGLAFLGWAGGARRRPRTLNDRVRPR